MPDGLPNPDLLRHWNDLLGNLGVEESAAVHAFNDLQARYAEPQRHYHTLEHIAALLTDLASCCDLTQDPAALQLAAYFHDVIYEPRACDNEERSADHAEPVLTRLGVGPATIAAVRDLILK